MTGAFGGPIRLTNLEQDHLGFILLAGSGYPMDAQEFQGDCVIMPLPQASSLFEEEPYLLLADHKDAGEHRFTLRRSGDQRIFEIRGPVDRELYVTLNPDGWGEWGIQAGGDRQCLGYSHSPSETAAREKET